MDPWHLVVALASGIVTALGILFRAMVRGDFVAGSTYRQDISDWKTVADAERKARHLAERRADKADVQVDRLTDAVREVTATVQTSLTQRDHGNRSDG